MDRVIEVGQFLRFDASNSTDNNEIVGYFWNFGDGNTSTETTTNHSYQSSGTYVVSLLVEDVSGNTDTDRIIVQAIEKDQKPIGSADWLLVAALLSLVVSISVILSVIWIMRFRKRAKEE